MAAQLIVLFQAYDSEEPEYWQCVHSQGSQQEERADSKAAA